MVKYSHLFGLAMVFILIISCQREYKGNKISQPKQQEEKSNDLLEQYSPVLNSVNFYLENSGSMNGYANGNTEFKNDIITLLSDLVLHVEQDSLKMNLVNMKIYPYKGDYLKFNKELTLRGIPTVGDISNSDINLIFKNILDKTTNNSISILVTDAIYSLEGKKKEDLVGLLKSASLETRNLFIEKLKNTNLSLFVLKMSSTFNGNYYPAEGGSVDINQKRPYYIWLFGNSEIIKNLNNKLKLKNLSGYSNDFYVLKSENRVVDYTILEYGKGKIGDFKNEQMHNYPISSIIFQDKEKHGEFIGDFGFGIAIDLSKVPLPEYYLLNEGNYVSTSSSYKVYEVININEGDLDENTIRLINKVEKEINSNFTHLILLKTNKKFIERNIKISIQNQVKKWVKETGVDDDSEIKNDSITTFGFHRLTSGIIEAYTKTNNSDDYISISVSIKS